MRLRPFPGIGAGKLGILFLAGGLLAGCASWSAEVEPMEALSKSSNGYNRLIRWSRFDEACAAYADATIRGECRDRIESLKEVHITDVKVHEIAYKAGDTDATVQTEIEYYMMPSATVRTIRDVQQWHYTEMSEKKVWMLKTLLPEFTNQ